MAQKEVIHLTFGTFSQHISTHFFNQQSSHFQFDDKVSSTSGSDPSNDDLLLDPNVDFQEGIGSRRNEQTFFPREVVVGFKEDMGTGWDAYNVTMKDEEEQNEEDYDENNVVLRPGNAVDEGFQAWSQPAELLHTGIRAGSQIRSSDDLNNKDGDLSASESEEEETISPSNGQEKFKPFTPENGKKRNVTRQRTPVSYALNPHHPRSLYPLSRLYGSGSVIPMDSKQEEGYTPFSSFEMGIILAKEMERENSLTEESIRWFAEDSDSLQSFQITTNTSDGFSGFTHEVLQNLSDEYPKTPIISWGAHWGSTQESSDEKASKYGRLRQMNNILSLWSLSSSSFYVPLQIPPHLANLPGKKDKVPLNHFSSKVDWTDEYQASALLSAHIDTATLRMRLRNPQQSISTASLVASLNWRRDTPIGSLGGCLPTPLLAPSATSKPAMDPIEALLASRGYGSRDRERKERNFETPQERATKAARQIQQYYTQFSTLNSKKEVLDNFAESIVARDGDELAASPTREALEAWTQLQEPVGQSTFVPLPYRIQSASFPQLFSRLTSTGRPMPEGYNLRPRVKSVPMISALSTSSGTSAILRQAQKYLDTRVIKGHDALQAFGLGGARGASAGQAASEESEGPLGGRDGMIEIRERLEELLGAYEGDNYSEEEEQYTDEEYQDQAEEWILDD